MWPAYLQQCQTIITFLLRSMLSAKNCNILIVCYTSVAHADLTLLAASCGECCVIGTTVSQHVTQQNLTVLQHFMLKKVFLMSAGRRSYRCLSAAGQSISKPAEVCQAAIAAVQLCNIAILENLMIHMLRGTRASEFLRNASTQWSTDLVHCGYLMDNLLNELQHAPLYLRHKLQC